MATFEATLEAALDKYVKANCELEIHAFGVGGFAPPYENEDTNNNGFNIDVGETWDFDITLTNGGGVGMNNVALRVECNERGLLSQSRAGLPGGWVGPWLRTIDVRWFNVGPNSSYTLRHASVGHLFAMKFDEPTGGTDNARKVEELITARIIGWEPDISLRTGGAKLPVGKFESFVQRS